jgi:hypothetical protein
MFASIMRISAGMFVACGGIMEYYFIQKKKVESAVLAADKV